jgi:PleD family two-component response regulator
VGNSLAMKPSPEFADHPARILIVDDDRHNRHFLEAMLLVEDEAGVRLLSKRILDNAGYRALEAANGDDAEKLFAHHADSIDLVVTDVIMPGCGGPELMSRLKVHVPAADLVRHVREALDR